MHTTTPYKRLSAAEREEISRGLAEGEDLSAIAGRLGRETSTVSREVRQNGTARVPGVRGGETCASVCLLQEAGQESIGERGQPAPIHHREAAETLVTPRDRHPYPRGVPSRYGHAHLSRGNLPLHLRTPARGAQTDPNQRTAARTRLPTEAEAWKP